MPNPDGRPQIELPIETIKHLYLEKRLSTEEIAAQIGCGRMTISQLQAFNKHLRKCRKNPVNIVLTDGKKTVVTPIRKQGLEEALTLRHESGQ